MALETYSHSMTLIMKMIILGLIITEIILKGAAPGSQFSIRA